MEEIFARLGISEYYDLGEIDEAIRLYEKIPLILSEHSVDSEWVTTEISNGRTREIQTGGASLSQYFLCQESRQSHSGSCSLHLNVPVCLVNR
jgi:hypothetical protein